MEANEVLDTSLLIDGRTGLTKAFNIAEYPKALERQIDVLWPINDDFLTPVGIMIDLLKAGTPVPALDVLVAAVCINRGMTLLTRDGHFSAVRAVRTMFKLSIVK